MPEDETTQWASQVSNSEDPEGLHSLNKVGLIGREEEVRDDRGNVDVDDEIVEFEDAADGGDRDGHPLGSTQFHPRHFIGYTRGATRGEATRYFGM